MTRLEARYRRLLRVLPRWYRDEREDELVAVYLSDVAAREKELAESRGAQVDGEVSPLRGEYGWPDWGEVATIGGLSLRTRFGGIDAPAPARRWGDTVRLIALLGILAKAAFAVVGSGTLLVANPEMSPALLPAPVDGRSVLFVLYQLIWVPAYLLLLTRRHRAVKIVSVVAALPSVVAVVGGGGFTLYSGLGLLSTLMPVVCLFLGFRRDAPEVTRPRWLAALAFAIIAAVLADLAFMAAGPEAWITLYPWADGAWALFLGGAVLLVGWVRSCWWARTSWLTAVAILAVPALLRGVARLVLPAGQEGVSRGVLAVSPILLTALIVLLLVAGNRHSATRHAAPVQEHVSH